MNSRNQLADETSPYLLEHADNPVNWYPWGEEALKKAREEDKPIFLSIGYSACHWCHVMKRESFEDPEIASLMNDLFVNIKVDREERPDLDEIYMNAVQAMTGRGGWPMSVFLTPQLEPFYGGTYFPPEPRQGMADFKTVLERVHEVYRDKPEELEKNTQQIVKRLEQMEQIGGEEIPSPDRLEALYSHLSNQFDKEWGGFGSSPKFPQVMNLQVLARMSEDTETFSGADAMLDETLERMSRGGMYDQVGGGFSRYSTDREWLVPHFEKMLYDNAQLMDIYTTGYRLFDEERYRRVVDETFQYLQRDMSHESGMFFSSQDAESDGEEGKYYVWGYDEFRDVVGEDADLFVDFFGVTKTGNFEGENILHRPESIDDFCGRHDLDRSTFEQRIDNVRERLLNYRNKRVAPHRDEKILTDWNSLMAAACARAGFYLNRSEYLDRARECLDSVLGRLVKGDQLFHTHRDGETHTEAFLSDYANLVKACLELFQYTGEEEWFVGAKRWYNQAVNRFQDDSAGGFYSANPKHADLIVNSKSPRDNAEPSGNSEMVMNALKLWALTGEKSYREDAEDILREFEPMLQEAPQALCRMMCGLWDYYTDTMEVVVMGQDNDREDFCNVLRNKLQFNRV
ncbi:MAG: thioredoxin domain-containing protein, partial [bacterium]